MSDTDLVSTLQSQELASTQVLGSALQSQDPAGTLAEEVVPTPPTSGRLRGKLAAEAGDISNILPGKSDRPAMSGRVRQRQEATAREAAAAEAAENPTALDTADGAMVVGGKQGNGANVALLQGIFDKFGAKGGAASQAVAQRGRSAVPSAQEMGAFAFAQEAALSEEELSEAKAKNEAANNKLQLINNEIGLQTTKAETARAEGDAEIARERHQTQEQLNNAQDSGQDALAIQRDRINEKLSRYEQAVYDYTNSPIEIRESRQQKAFNTIAIAMGAFAQAQNGGVNGAAEIVMASLDRDLRVQQMEINRKGKTVDFANNALANARSLFDDEVQAQAGARNMMIQDMKLRIDEVAARTSSVARRHEAQKLGQEVLFRGQQITTGMTSREWEVAERNATSIKMADLNAQRGTASRRAELRFAAEESARKDNFAAVREQRKQIAGFIRKPRMTREKWAVSHRGLKAGYEGLAELDRAFAMADAPAAGVYDSTKPGFMRDKYEQAIKATWDRSIIGTITKQEDGRVSDAERKIAFESFGTGTFTTEEQARGGLLRLRTAYYQVIVEALKDNPMETVNSLGMDIVNEALEAEVVAGVGGMGALGR